MTFLSVRYTSPVLIEQDPACQTLPESQALFSCRDIIHISRIHPLKLRFQVVFLIYAGVYNHRHYLIPEYFHRFAFILQSLQKSLHNPGSQSFSPMFSSPGIIVLGLEVKAVYSFEVRVEVGWLVGLFMYIWHINFQ